MNSHGNSFFLFHFYTIYNIIRILGWNKSDILEQNVIRIMPKIYADLHDKFMENYLETSEGKVLGIERTVLCINKVTKILIH